ncbi:hypothetical protein D3C87_965670 [compost metagenome]
MQQPMRMPAPLNTEAGRAELYTNIGRSAARPRSKAKPRRFTEPGFDSVMAWAIAGTFIVYAVAKIAPGLPAVLRAHGF